MHTCQTITNQNGSHSLKCACGMLFTMFAAYFRHLAQTEGKILN